ncbi:MAG: hypothetical protein ACLPZY_03430 [Terracidiphilus sp.]
MMKPGKTGMLPARSSFIPPFPALKGDQIIESPQSPVKINGEREKREY